MATIENRQRLLVNQFTHELVEALSGVAACTHVAGIGEKFGRFRRGREATRPPVVTLEPTRQGLFLGLVISRPCQGSMSYSKVLGRWDFANPIRPGGLLDATIPAHRRAAFWAADMAEQLLSYARQRVAGTALPLQPATFPRLLVPFKPGEEQIDEAKHAANPTAFIQREASRVLVDASIASEAAVAGAIEEDRVLEDHRPVLGQQAANPLALISSFAVPVRNPAKDILARYGVTDPESVTQELLDRMVYDFWAETAHLTIAEDAAFQAFIEPDAPVPAQMTFETAVRSLTRAQLLAVARQYIGPAAGSMTDEDVLAAVHQPQQDINISYRSKIQIVSVDGLQDPPYPYVGSLLPPVNWRPTPASRPSPQPS
jgi:hypothetical protein